MTTEIIDPIHGFIVADEAEMRVIDDPAFQRLRRINQLAGAHMVYPGARHARFEHSLGTMHISGMAASSLMSCGRLAESQARALRLAGLVHDIGHGPFSHLFESVMRAHRGLGGAGHEEIGRRILAGTSLGDALGRDRRRVAGLAFGGPAPSALPEIISGVMGTDTMDYLLRDGHFTGSEHARVDHRRLVSSLVRLKGRMGLARSALHSFESMMHSRRQMFRTVYFHRAVRAAQSTILRAFDLAADELGLGSLTLGEYVALTDDSAMALLRSLRPETRAVRDAQVLAREYESRALPRCVLDVALEGRAPDAAAMRAEVASAAGVAESLVLVDVTGASAVPLAAGGRAVGHVTLVGEPRGEATAEDVPFSRLPLLAALLGPAGTLRVYARGNTKKVAAAASAAHARWHARGA